MILGGHDIAHLKYKFEINSQRRETTFPLPQYPTSMQSIVKYIVRLYTMSTAELRTEFYDTMIEEERHQSKKRISGRDSATCDGGMGYVCLFCSENLQDWGQVDASAVKCLHNEE